MNKNQPRSQEPDDICPRPDKPVNLTTQPLAPAIYPTSVWICNEPAETDRMLGGQAAGYVYQRDRHPNADALAEKVRELHAAERAIITSSGMAALSAAVLSQLTSGDHVVLSNQLYGKTSLLVMQELGRLGIASTVVDTCDHAATRVAIVDKTKLVVVETIANPCLQVANITELAKLSHERGAKLLVDNTFATPALCRPLQLGADFVMESISKMMNGHSDVMLGALCGYEQVWERVPGVSAAFGLASGPFNAWLALRGLTTMHLRMDRACETAIAVAEFLVERTAIEHVDYPGLASHPQHTLAKTQLDGRYGCIVTFRLAGGRPAADSFILAAESIPFCPSLGESCTTLSHPETTSHRTMSAEEREALGIHGGTIRLSIGIESAEFVIDALERALGQV